MCGGTLEHKNIYDALYLSDMHAHLIHTRIEKTTLMVHQLDI